METKIAHTIKEWLPWSIEGNEVSEYTLLHNLADYCRNNVHRHDYEKALEVIKIINLLYTGGSRHVRNAIENEFLEVLAMDEAPASLKEHMKVLPQMLKEAYIKTILEN